MALAGCLAFQKSISRCHARAGGRDGTKRWVSREWGSLHASHTKLETLVFFPLFSFSFGRPMINVIENEGMIEILCTKPTDGIRWKFAFSQYTQRHQQPFCFCKNGITKSVITRNYFNIKYLFCVILLDDKKVGKRIRDLGLTVQAMVSYYVENVK